FGQHVGTDAHRVAQADAGEQWRVAREHGCRGSDRGSNELEAGAICPEACDRPGIQEVELEVAEAPTRKGPKHGGEMFGGSGMRHVENPHSPVPVETRVSTLDE